MRRSWFFGIIAAIVFAFAPVARAAQNTLTTPGAPLTMTQLATFLNNAYTTIATNYSGATPPAVCTGGTACTFQFWLDTSTTPNTLRMYDGAQWTSLGLLNTSTHNFSISLDSGGLGGSQAAATVGQVPVYPGSGGAAVPTDLYPRATINVMLAPYSAKADNVTDDSAAIRSAIAALPASGGDIIMPPGTGCYVLTANRLDLGDGNGTTVSTRNGIRLIGGGAGQGLTGVVGLPNNSPTCIISNIAGPAISVNGPISGWGISNISVRANTTSTSAGGLYALSSNWGEVSNFSALGFYGYGVKEHVIDLAGPLAGYSSFRNQWKDVYVYVGPGAATGVSISGDTLTDTYAEVWDNLFIQPTDVLNTDLYIGSADTLTFNNLIVNLLGAGASKGIVFDYSVSPTTGWPGGIVFNQLDLFNNTVTNVGSPPVTTTSHVTMNGFSTGNGAVPPRLNSVRVLSENYLYVPPTQDFNITGTTGANVTTFGGADGKVSIIGVNADQLKLGYDSTHYSLFDVSSAGVLTVGTNAGRIILNPFDPYVSFYNGVTALFYEPTLTRFGTLHNDGTNFVISTGGTSPGHITTPVQFESSAAAPQLVLGANTTTLGAIKMFGNTSGDATLEPPAIAGTSTVITLPGATGTLATLAGSETLTNKTLDTSVGKGTWTASGIWTLPAFTLGGTILGGGNQINNVIIGSGTPLAGSFTALTATSLGVTNSQNAHTYANITNGDAGAGAAAGYSAGNGVGQITFGQWGKSASAYGALVANVSFLYGSTDFVFMSDGGNLIFASGGSSEKARFTTTGGLAVGATTDPGLGGIFVNANLWHPTVANASIATALSSVGPTGSHTTVQEWFPIKNASGTIRYVPGF